VHDVDGRAGAAGDADGLVDRGDLGRDGRASGKFATAPRPSAISLSPASLSIAPSSQCSSVTEPAAFAALAAPSRARSSAARSGSVRNILMLACPRPARAAISPSGSAPGW
jgi:hypothetical protein